MMPAIVTGRTEASMTRYLVASIARMAGLFFGGIFAGFLVTVLVLEGTLRRYDASVYTQVRHVELIHLDDLASATLLPALLATVVLIAATVRSRGTTFRWTIAALILLVTVLVTTVVVNLPINADQLDWAVQAPPADWAQVRDRWQLAHAVRTGAAVVAFACLVRAGSRRRADRPVAQ
jgi:uncharacterized membrane protein